MRTATLFEFDFSSSPLKMCPDLWSRDERAAIACEEVKQIVFAGRVARLCVGFTSMSSDSTSQAALGGGGIPAGGD
jgi:hypothetical protein